MIKSAVDRVLIYVRSQREWYYKPNRGTTKHREEAHRYLRWRAERLVGTDADIEPVTVGWCHPAQPGPTVWRNDQANRISVTHWMPLPEPPAVHAIGSSGADRG